MHETLTPAMIACGFADVQEYKPAVSGKNPVHPVHPCESKIYPCLTLSRLPATRRSGLFQASRAPAPHDGADHSRVKQRIFMACREQGPCRAKPVFYLLNMDAQDKQDKQHERLCHRSRPA